ncbi:MAG: orotate phosphoribosyltransferase [Candidatus Nealsonbacteria bacterium]|nr:orotate phosphoribosyltransferase [Candidatus Nealsonbacteria bacterium]
MEDKHWVEEIFEECGATLYGHFELTSGRHAEKYLDKAIVLAHTTECCDICWQIAQEVGMHYIDVEAVVGPAYGGIILSHNVARALEDFCGEVLALFTEKDKQGKQVLKRGYKKLLAGKKVLIVDDILTTGGSIKQVIKEVEDAGGQVMAVAVICNREGVTSKDIGGYPLFSLWNTNIESWESDNCPLCKENIPLEDPKSR